jgi:hypothetical protein
VPADEVLAGPRLRDDWRVIGQRDQVEERLTTRRTWLHGVDTGRFALVLSFAAPGQTLSGDLTLGTVVDADLCFYPGAQPLRALVAASNEPVAPTGPPPGPGVSATLDRYAEALARDPWLDRWPVLVGGALVTHAGSWHLRDGDGAGLRLDPAAGDPWRLVGAAGGQPLTVAGEWSPSGLRALTGWVDDRMVRA